MEHRQSTVKDERNPADGLADLFIYLPIGAAMALREMFPDLAEKGRRLVEDRLTSARLLGEMAFKQAERAGSSLIERGRIVSMGGTGADRTGPDSRTVEFPPVAATDAPDATPATAAPDDSAPDNTADDTDSPPVAISDLPIPGYDTLSASQVVQRLDGLSKQDMAAVRDHEKAGRGRQTILNRIAQLSAAS